MARNLGSSEQSIRQNLARYLEIMARVKARSTKLVWLSFLKVKTESRNVVRISSGWNKPIFYANDFPFENDLGI